MPVKLHMTPVEEAAILETRFPLGQRQEIIDAFHRLTYDERRRNKTWGGTKFRGYNLWKLPSDLWLYRDVIMKVKPRTIVETGTAHGGSALYFASLLDELGGGVVLTIDIQPLKKEWPAHPRIFYAPNHDSKLGIPKSWKVASNMHLEQPQKLEPPVMVILDSDHARDHVRAELDVYAPLVTPGSYLVVEDTNVNGHPACVEHGPGPQEALDDWLPQDKYRIDAELSDRYLFSYHTWLRRI